MAFFAYFQTVPYTLPEGNTATFQTRQITPLMERVTLETLLQAQPGVFMDYIIQEHQRPDHVAQAVYGDVGYTWLVMLANDITLADWPLSDEQFAAYIVATYGSINTANITTVAYFDGNGFEINLETYNARSDPLKRTMRAYQLEFQRNDARRAIQLIVPALAPALDRRLKSLLSS